MVFMTCLVSPSLVEMDLNSISGYFYKTRITLVWAPSPVTVLQGESKPCFDVGHQLVAGASMKWLSAALQFGEHSAELQPGVLVYILGMCS